MLVDSTAYTSEPSTTKGVVMQLQIDTAANGASQGVQSTATMTFLTDEI